MNTYICVGIIVRALVGLCLSMSIFKFFTLFCKEYRELVIYSVFLLPAPALMNLCNHISRIHIAPAEAKDRIYLTNVCMGRRILGNIFWLGFCVSDC